MTRVDPAGDRYSRQVRFSHIGSRGQERISSGRILVIGCGGLGTGIVNLLARSGVGTITVVDRDLVELSNLQRQLLFEESDARAGTPKAVAAAAACERINSEITVVPVVADVGVANIEALVEEADVVLDATDNLQTRYLINDACVKLGVPWIYGGAVGSNGMTMTVIPGETACLRCLWPTPPAAGAVATCATVGVLGSAVVVVAALQWTEAIKLLVGDRDHLSRTLRYLDLWSNDYEQGQAVPPLADCPCCGQRKFDFLTGESGGDTLSLCGRDAVQVRPGTARTLDLSELATRLQPIGEVTVTRFMLRLQADGRELTLFPDGRAIIKGTDDPGVARSLYSQYVGD
jgi:molybdopterin-synthase adenylyltransferase